MNNNCVLKGTMVRCQKNPCNNISRLIENYYGKAEDYKCPICSGGSFVSPVTDKLFPANSFTLCEKCETIFLIKKDYVGKALTCEDCENKAKISSLQNNSSFKTRNRDRKHNHIPMSKDKLMDQLELF